jgi:adenine-specific DNA-methyltransferase
MPTLDFKGKPFVYSHHLSVPFREFIIDQKKSIPSGGNASLDDNLIIHGDNLEALKALLPRYAGKVDVIYIDPPYNTGNEGWAYNDNVNSPLMKEWLGKVVDREDLERHEKWLCMMWPRLMLLHELLSPNGGLLLVSCDDEECHHLRTILDEIFGESNFIAQLVWKSRTSEDTRAKTRVSKDHEYILVYSSAPNGSLRGVEKDEAKFANPDNDPRGPWRSADLTGLATKDRRPNLHYDLIDPETHINYGCPPKGWRYERPTMDRKIAEKRILWPPDPTGRPRHKLFLNEIKSRFKNVSSVIGNVGTEHGTRELNQILGDGVFDFPKPTSLLSSLIEQAGPEDSLVLDAFAGSGSTGHAVLKLNEADSGTRRFILIQLPEQIRKGTPAFEAGFRDVADVTAERVRRAISGVPEAKDESLRKGLGGSFAYCELGEPIDLDRFFDGESAPRYGQVARYVIYTATGQSVTDVPDEPAKHWFVGEAGGYRIHLIYKPNLDFMRGNEAALSMPLAQEIAKSAQGKPVLVYAAAKFMAQFELTKLGITFCQLPYAIHRVLGEAPDAP